MTRPESPTIDTTSATRRAAQRAHSSFVVGEVIQRAQQQCGIPLASV
jgi:hypothetical protein